MKSFRSKPVGWTNESYRHYLAAKGIKTKTKYFASETAFGRAVEGFGKAVDARRRRVALSAVPYAQGRLSVARAQAKAPSLRGLKSYRRWLDKDGNEVPEGTSGAIREKETQVESALRLGLTPDEQVLKKAVLESAGIGTTEVQKNLARAHEFNEIVGDDYLHDLMLRQQLNQESKKNIIEDTKELQSSIQFQQMAEGEQQNALQNMNRRLENEDKNIKNVKEEYQFVKGIVDKYPAGDVSPKERQKMGAIVIWAEKQRNKLVRSGGEVDA